MRERPALQHGPHGARFSAGTPPCMCARFFYRNICISRCIIACIVQRQTFDSEYIRRLTQSDPETERDFAEYFGELLALKLRSRLRSPDAISDVIQETFLRVYRALRKGE